MLQITTATLLALVVALLVKHLKSGLHIWTGVGFTICIFCYLVIESETVQSMPVLRGLATFGAICVPVQFWLLSRAIFDDHFKFKPPLLTWFLVQIIPHFNDLIFDLAPGAVLGYLSSIIARVTSLGFVLAGVYTALQTRKGDLVDSRIRFRNIFIIITAALIGVTLIAEIVPVDKEITLVLQVLQRAAISVVTLYFLLGNFGLRPGFFFKEIPKPKPPAIDDPLLNAKLQNLLEEQKIYRKEGLTIRELAALMNEQEYRLRRLINGQLGFRNFNDFLNQYRINDACGILSDPAQTRKTILEIAFELGYQSVGPFNKAFRDLRGTTPTAYRKSQAG